MTLLKGCGNIRLFHSLWTQTLKSNRSYWRSETGRFHSGTLESVYSATFFGYLFTDLTDRDACDKKQKCSQILLLTAVRINQDLQEFHFSSFKGEVCIFYVEILSPISA